MSGSRRPFLQHSLALLRSRFKLAETVHGDVKSQEILQNLGEEVHASADELVFVQFHGHVRPAHEMDPMLRNYPAEMPAAGQRLDAGDLPVCIAGLGEVVKPQNLL